MMEYKTVFVESHFKSKSSLSGERWMVNGDQTGRDVHAAINDFAGQGYELVSTENITSSKHSVSFTQGILLIFKKDADKS